MSVSRKGFQILGSPHPSRGSHVSGKSAKGFAARIKPNLDEQCKRLEQELCTRPPKTAVRLSQTIECQDELL